MLKGEHKIIKCDCEMEDRGGVKVHIYGCAIRKSYRYPRPVKQEKNKSLNN